MRPMESEYAVAALVEASAAMGQMQVDIASWPRLLGLFLCLDLMLHKLVFVVSLLLGRSPVGLH